MQRPKGIEITTWLMMLSVLVGIVLTATLWNSVAYIHIKPGSKASVESVVAFFRVASILGAVISAVCAFFYWKGREWARILVLIDCFFCLYSLLKLRLQWQTSHFGAVETVFNALLAIYLLWYLFRPEVRTWFTEQTAAAHPRMPKPQPA